MIKLIASDLDGTLIPEGEQELEPGFLEVLQELLDKGFLFYAASGRQYANMKQKFSDFAGRMGFICENGGIAMEGGRPQYLLELPWKKAAALAEDIMSFPAAEVMLSGVKACYIKPKTEWFRRQVMEVLKNESRIFQELEEIDDQIVKLSAYVYDFQENAGKLQAFFREKYGEYGKFVIAGNNWLDLMPDGCGKGAALEAILKKKGITPEEIMVFGDNQNDISMLDATPNSYAMAHARPDVRAHAVHTCVSVTETLRILLNSTGMV